MELCEDAYQTFPVSLIYLHSDLQHVNNHFEGGHEMIELHLVDQELGIQIFDCFGGQTDHLAVRLFD